MKKIKYLLILITLELFLTAMGMGVPIFLIVFGFFFGFFLARKILVLNRKNSLRTIFNHSLLASGFSFLIMLGIWGTYFLNIFDKNFDIVNSGIPMILYEPFASFIGWTVLMIFISPFLQFLMALFGAYVVLIFISSSKQVN